MNEALIDPNSFEFEWERHKRIAKGKVPYDEVKQIGREFSEIAFGKLKDSLRVVDSLNELLSECDATPEQKEPSLQAFREMRAALIDFCRVLWEPVIKTGFVYFVLAPHSLAVKIGYTSNHPAQRLIALQIGTPEPLLLLGYIDAAEYTETFLHELFREHRIRGEWFQFCEDVCTFIRFTCVHKAPEETLGTIPHFSADKWNCDPWPTQFPSTQKEITSWLGKPTLY